MCLTEEGIVYQFGGSMNKERKDKNQRANSASSNPS
jgi:hypothetical protein